MKRPTQSDTTLEELNRLIWEHLEARDWGNAASRSLAICLSLEANELLEHYQWSDQPIGDKKELAAELADILIYAFQFAQQNNIDIAQAVQDKLATSARKYPAEKFKGKEQTERRDLWVKTKKQHRKKGL